MQQLIEDKNYYAILGLGQVGLDATDVEIKQACTLSMLLSAFTPLSDSLVEIHNRS